MNQFELKMRMQDKIENSIMAECNNNSDQIFKMAENIGIDADTHQGHWTLAVQAIALQEMTWQAQLNEPTI